MLSYRSLTKEILYFLANAGYAVLDGFLPPNYPEAKLARLLLGMDHKKSRAAAKRNLSSTLHRLKLQGLVTCSGSRKCARWQLTRTGKTFLAKIQDREKGAYVLAPQDGVIRIVAFDIPERFRAKRNWLREQLAACGYQMLQRSIFMSTRPLPDAFIKRVDEMKIRQYLHIASLNQSGTIRNKKEEKW
ncbi:MAG: CRISPR-associated endonuclease Cas2 [Candidatus Sungbacteria bacterium]|nr:CRISPR-associated endonuclease Cas2 [Candidatus Sungbacteria bacterium]